MEKETLDNIAVAVANGRTDIVRTLINVYENGNIGENKKNKDFICEQLLNKLCTSEGTLLHLATKLDHVDIVRTLLSSGADPTIKNMMGELPYDLLRSKAMAAVYTDELLKCAAKSEIEHLRQLIIAGVDINSHDSPESRNTALHWAVCFGKPEAVQCLLDLGAAPNMLNGQGATPLHDAVKRKNVEIIKILLAAGANPTIKGISGKFKDKTPLHLAEGNKEMSDLLIESMTNPSSMEHKDSEDATQNEGSETSNTNDLNESVKSLSLASIDCVAKQNISTPTLPQAFYMPSLMTSPLPLITEGKLHLLWPQPQNMMQTEGQPFKLTTHMVHIIRSTSDSLSQSIIDVWNLHLEEFKSTGVECCIDDITEQVPKTQGNIVCCVNPRLFTRKESYKLIIASDHIRVLACDLRCLHYSLCTLGQLFRLYQEEHSLPPLYIHDWPHLCHRAVLLDFSKGSRKPTLDALKGFIKTMSFLKVNKLHCYFRYELRQDFSLPFSNRDLIDLSKYCSQYFIDIVPAIDIEASSTCDNIECNYIPVRKLATLFSATEVHIGPKLSKVLTDVLTKKSKTIWNLLSIPSCITIFLCANGVHFTPELLRMLPLNSIFIEFGYQVEHDYDYSAKILTPLGFNVCIGTGTASWGSISGCPEMAIASIHKASQAALVHGCFGLVVADWKTTPHHTALTFSWPGIVIALGLSWNSSVHVDYLHARLSELLNHHVFQDAEQITAYLTIELGRLEAFMHQSIQSQKECTLSLASCETSVLHQLLVDPDAVALENFTFDLLQQAVRHLKKFEIDLLKAKPVCFQNGEIVAELRLAMDLLMFACRLGRVMVSTGLNPNTNSCGFAVINVGIGNLPPIARTDLANRLLGIIEQFRAVWLSRNLPCGLQTSLHLFSSLLCKLIPKNDQLLYSANGDAVFFHELYSSNEMLQNQSI